MKIKFISTLILVAIAFYGSQAANPPHARIGIVSLIDTAATHIFSNRFSSTFTYRDFFNYEKYSANDLKSLFADDGTEVVEIEEHINYESTVFVNLIGRPGSRVKMWLSSLKDKYDLDYLIVILRKFIPDPDMSNRHLGEAQYGIATYLHHRGIVSIFSYVGYYVYSLSDFKTISLNSNHDKHILLDFPVDHEFTYDELQSLPEDYTGMAASHLQNIVYTRDRELYRVITEYQKKLNAE